MGHDMSCVSVNAMHIFCVAAMADVADEPHAAGDKRQTILHFGRLPSLSLV